MAPVHPLSSSEEAIAQRVANLILANQQPILTREEAMRHTKNDSDSAFDRWCARWKVKPCYRGRYARGQLDRAMVRESGARAATPKRNALAA